MKFQNCISKKIERTDGRTHGQAQRNMPLQLFQSWGHKNEKYWPDQLIEEGYSFLLRELSGSVVECLTRNRRAAGSSLIGVTALWSLSKTHLS